MRARVVIDERFRGPPASANGGYACGLVGREIGGAAWASLRVPPPLGRALDLHERAGGELELRDGEILVAEGGPAELSGDVPAPPAIADAARSVERFAWWHDHPFPGCFVCGPHRAEGDGLRIFPGQVGDRAIVASPWTPDASLAGPDGSLPPELVWAVLDCPTSFGAALDGAAGRPAVLARLTAELAGSVRAEEPHVVIGWPIGRAGRKAEGGAAIFTAAGELLARSRGLWIELKQPSGGAAAPGEASAR